VFSFCVTTITAITTITTLTVIIARLVESDPQMIAGVVFCLLA
jgi:hypothetical protein